MVNVGVAALGLPLLPLLSLPLLLVQLLLSAVAWAVTVAVVTFEVTDILVELPDASVTAVAAAAARASFGVDGRLMDASSGCDCWWLCCVCCCCFEGCCCCCCCCGVVRSLAFTVDVLSGIVL